jgi:hypothetical protein
MPDSLTPSGRGLVVDRDAITVFCRALFRYAEPGGFASLRAFRHDGQPIVQTIPFSTPDVLAEAAAQMAQHVADGPPAVFAPPICIFDNARTATNNDVKAGLVLSVDLDATPDEGRRRLEALLGAATIIVVTGGRTPEGANKLHLHWRLSEPTTTPEDHARLKEARAIAARLVGGDASGNAIVHPFRWPGSWHTKGEPRPARIIVHNDNAEVHLDEALDRLREAAGTIAAEAPRAEGPRAPSDLRGTREAIEAALRFIPNNDLPWNDWRDIGMALKGALDDDGRDLFLGWSAQSGKNNARETARLWRSFKPHSVGAGTIYHAAREAGWKPEPHLVLNAAMAEAAKGPNPAQHFLDRIAAGEAAGPAPATSHDWPAPVDLLADEHVTGRPELRPEHVPSVIHDVATDTAERLGVDPCAVALAAIVAVSGICNDLWRVQPKRHDHGWSEAPRLWGAIIGPPSTMKSPIISAATRPIEQMERQAQHLHDEAVRKWRAENLGNSPEARAPEPRRSRYMIESATLEAVEEALRDDLDAKFLTPAHKLLVRRDELTEWLGSMDAYKAGGTGGADRAAWLTAYNGAQRSVDRVKRGALTIAHFSCSLLGGIQPDPLRRMAKNFGDDGLIQRFLTIELGDAEPGADREPNQAALDAYSDLFNALAKLAPEAEGLSGYRRVKLDEEAQRHREDFDLFLLGARHDPDASPQLRTMLAKWPGSWARLALVFHLVELASRAKREPYILDGATAGRATRFFRDVLYPHALRLDRLLGDSAGAERVRRIADHILADRLSIVTARDLQRSIRGIRKTEERPDFIAAMSLLHAFGWIRPDDPRARPDTITRWHVNPAVHSTFGHRAAEAAARREERRAEVLRAMGRRA